MPCLIKTSGGKARRVITIKRQNASYKEITLIINPWNLSKKSGQPELAVKGAGGGVPRSIFTFFFL